MNKNTILIKYTVLFLFFIFSLYPKTGIAQNTNNTVLDSLITINKANVADITIKLSETDFKTNIIINNLKNDTLLKSVKNETDSLIRKIKKDIKSFRHEEKNLNKKNNRRLGNARVFWEQELSKVNSKINNVSYLISEYDKKIHDFNKEQKRIIITLKFLKENNEAYSIQKKAKSIKYKIDKIIKDLNSKKNYSVTILEKLINIKAQIVPIVDNITLLVGNRKTSIAEIEQESLFAINYLDKTKWDFSGFSSLIEGESNRLYVYILDNIIAIISHIIVIILSILLFSYLNNNPINDITTKPTAFKLYFHQLLNHPISLGILMGLLSFIDVYSTSPLVFIDVYRFLFVAPLFYILNKVLNKKFRTPVYILLFALVAQILYTFIPEETNYSRILLLIVSIAEFSGVLWIFRYIHKNEISDYKLFRKLTFYITSMYLIAVTVGVIANIIGMVVFAEIILSNIITSILAITLIFLLLIVSNGLSISFFESETANKINSIRNNSPRIIKNTTRLTNFIVSFLLAHLITKAFGIEQKIIDVFFTIVNHQIDLGSISFSIGGIFTFFFVIWISLTVSNIIKTLLEEDILKKIEIETGLQNTISTTIKYGIIAIGFLIAISAAGIPLNQMAIVFSAFGVGIGFGLQNIFNNLVSGFILLFERPIKIGDTVEVGTLIGRVMSIGIRSSKVRTFDGAEIIVPNGNLISNEVINWTLSDRKRRVEVIIGISYDSDPHKAKEIFLETLKKNPHVVSNPEPEVYFRDLGESSLDFRLLFWTFNDWIKVRSEIVFDAFDALKEAGIEIPFPQQDLHLRSIDNNVEIKTSNKKG
jgi:small-conductance mechanosensitive channel